ncbi:MAG TPA: hypothetical protein VMI10_05450 [Terriglobales bacterium]|nr:hypothetical protein [Terriglobales bacterium]
MSDDAVPAGGASPSANCTLPSTGSGGGGLGQNYTPVPLNPPPQRARRPASMTVSEVQELGTFFKGLIEQSSLAKWVIMAGAAAMASAIMEFVHLGWLAAKYFLQR